MKSFSVVAAATACVASVGATALFHSDGVQKVPTRVCSSKRASVREGGVWREQLLSRRRVTPFQKFSAPSSSTPMASVSVGEQSAVLPETLTEFMVDMKCERCAANVRRNVEPLAGVSSVEIDLGEKVVRVSSTSPLQELEDALRKTGLRSRLIGRGELQQLGLRAAVAEFKGPTLHGVVRFTQVNMERGARVEAQFDGLRPNARHGWSVNEYGDLTDGPRSTGGQYNPTGEPHGGPDDKARHAGDLGNLEADDRGHANYVAVNDRLQVWDLIGRSVVVYEGEDDLGRGGTPESSIGGNAGARLAAAVIARSAGVGENRKSLCTCDGTVIWEATDSDYVSGGALAENAGQ